MYHLILFDSFTISLKLKKTLESIKLSSVFFVNAQKDFMFFEIFKHLHNQDEYEDSNISFVIVKLNTDKLGCNLQLKNKEEGSRLYFYSKK